MLSIDFASFVNPR